MRPENIKRIVPILMVFLLALAYPVWAQQNTDESETNIDTTVAVWGNHVVDDSSKAEEYGQVPEGFLINSFNVDARLKADRFLDLRGRRVGLNNAQYGFDYGVWGKYKLYIDYTKIPHEFSKSGETIWTEVNPGEWRLPDVVQQTVQNLNPFDPFADPVNYAAGLANQRLFVKNLLTNAAFTSLALQRNRGTAGFTFSPNINWKYNVEYFRENRDGTRPFGTTFGFSWATELPEPIDYSTDRMHAAAEYTGKGKTFSIAYDLSLFRNENQAIIWDNPLRFTDRTYSSAYVNGDGTSQGRAQLATDNDANTITFAGMSNLGKGRLSGNFAWSGWTDSVGLLPFTINTAITGPELTLPSDTFNGNLRNITANLRYYLPVGKGNFTAAYRLYDQSNNNDQFLFEHYVRLDQVEEEFFETECDPTTNTCVETPGVLNTHFAYRYHNVDLDFLYPLADQFHWYAGYSFNKRDLEGRETNSTDTNVFKAGLDYLASNSLTVRFSYVYSQRRLDQFEITSPVYLPIFTPLTRYDIANLNRNQFRVLADYAIGDKSSLSAAFTFYNNDYPDTIFGLQKAKNWSISGDYSYAMTPQSTFNVWYEHQRNTTDQTGQQSTEAATVIIQGAWAIGLDDDYDTVGAGYQWIAKDQKYNWDANVTYARANGLADITSSFLPGTRAPATGFGNADDTDLFSFRGGLAYKAFRHARFAFRYNFDAYRIDDFAEDSTAADLIGPVPQPVPPGGVTFPGTITLNAIQPKYTYHTGWIGFIYSW